jgi:hypothetical protein
MDAPLDVPTGDRCREEPKRDIDFFAAVACDAVDGAAISQRAPASLATPADTQ